VSCCGGGKNGWRRARLSVRETTRDYHSVELSGKSKTESVPKLAEAYDSRIRLYFTIGIAGMFFLVIGYLISLVNSPFFFSSIDYLALRYSTIINRIS